MKRYLLSILLLISSLTAFSQGTVGVQMGLGSTTEYSTFITPAYSVEYLKSINESVNFGLAVFYENYTFTHTLFSQPHSYGPNTYEFVEHNSDYLFLAPKIDIALDRKKQIFHFFTTLGIGRLLSGNQSTEYAYYANVYKPSSPSGRGYMWSVSNNDYSDKINQSIFRIGTGFTQYVKIAAGIHVTLTEEFGLIPSKLSRGIQISPDFRENYVVLKAGIAYKYRKSVKKPKPPKKFEKDYMEY